MGFKVRLRDFFYANTLEEIKNKYKRDRLNFKIDTLTERELRCLMQYEILQPTKYNNYEPLKDIEFLLDTRMVKKLSTSQIRKKHILSKTITNYLMASVG